MPMNNEEKIFPKWGEDSGNNPSFKYLYTTLDDKILPKVSNEDLRALSDYPLIYIYVSDNQEENRYFYIGQTNNIYNRIREHSKKLNNDSYDRFKKFKGGKYFAFYDKKISQHLDFIEKRLLQHFIEKFHFLNFINMNKDGNYISKVLANKVIGNESGKYQDLRQKLEKCIVIKILELLKEERIISVEEGFGKNVSSLFEDSPFFELTKNQNEIKESILNNEDRIRIHLIKGGAGTGKTILLLHLIAAIKQKKKNAKIAIFVRNQHRKRFTKVLNSYGLTPNKTNIELVTFSSLESSKETYDYIFIDEAQRATRLTEKLIYPTGAKNETDILKKLNNITNDKKYLSTEEFQNLKYPTVLHYIHEKYDSAKLIIAYDKSQTLREVDSEDIEGIFIGKEEVNSTPELEAQLRILKGNDMKFANNFVNFVALLLNNQLDGSNFEELIIKNNENNYLKIAESIEEWKSYIIDKQKRFPHKKSLRLAGYCKPLKKDKIFLEGDSKEDTLKWNADGEKWRKYNVQSTELGNVYDIHGFDIDFAAVYIGRDIRLTDENKIQVDKDYFFDKGTKKGVANIDQFVKNAYYILLTRAIYGQMIYIEDEALRKFLMKKFRVAEKESE